MLLQGDILHVQRSPDAHGGMRYVYRLVDDDDDDVAATQACVFDDGAADADADDNYQQNGGGDRRINDDDSDASSDGDEPLLGDDAAPAPDGALDRALRAPRGPPAGAAGGAAPIKNDKKLRQRRRRRLRALGVSADDARSICSLADLDARVKAEEAAAVVARAAAPKAGRAQHRRMQAGVRAAPQTRRLGRNFRGLLDDAGAAVAASAGDHDALREVAGRLAHVVGRLLGDDKHYDKVARRQTAAKEREGQRQKAQKRKKAERARHAKKRGARRQANGRAKANAPLGACFDFARGKCRRGASCKFSHAPGAGGGGNGGGNGGGGRRGGKKRRRAAPGGFNRQVHARRRR